MKEESKEERKVVVRTTLTAEQWREWSYKCKVKGINPADMLRILIVQYTYGKDGTNGR